MTSEVSQCVCVYDGLYVATGAVYHHQPNPGDHWGSTITALSFHSTVSFFKKVKKNTP